MYPLLDITHNSDVLLLQCPPINIHCLQAIKQGAMKAENATQRLSFTPPQTQFFLHSSTVHIGCLSCLLSFNREEVDLNNRLTAINSGLAGPTNLRSFARSKRSETATVRKYAFFECSSSCFFPTNSHKLATKTRIAQFQNQRHQITSLARFYDDNH